MGCGASTEEDLSSVRPRIAALPRTPPAAGSPAGLPVSPSVIEIESTPITAQLLTSEQRAAVREQIQTLRAQAATEIATAKSAIHELKQDLRDNVAEMSREMREMKATLEIFLHRQSALEQTH